MKTVRSLYLQMCRSKLEALGFVCRKQTFVRLIGDVVQAFTLEKTVGVPRYRVVFHLYPLCVKQPIYVDAGVYELNRFCDDFTVMQQGWLCKTDSLDALEHSVEPIVDAIYQHLIPLFNKCNCSSITLSELLKLEKYFDDKRRLFSQQSQLEDLAEPWYARALFDSRKYYLALKAKDYGFAKEYLLNQIQQLHLVLKETEYSSDAARREKHYNKLKQHQEELKRLAAWDIDYFEQLLIFNEKETRKRLADEYPKLFH